MKVTIRTVFRTENCGSYLQAWALNEMLSAMGNEVIFSDYKSPVATKDKLLNVLKCYGKLKFKKGSSILKKMLAFNKARKSLKVSKDTNACDLCFFGSDTLWNFKDEFFVDKASFFTGEDVAKPCYAYAISIGSTSKEDFIKQGKAVQNIQKFKKISVRDIHTKNVLSEIYPDENIVKSVDPTMLLEKDVYERKFASKKIIEEKYLLIYYFGTIPKDVWQHIKNLAKAKGLKIVNVGFYDKMFDVNLPFSIENFITAYKNSEYVFTNTFHGCVFSIIFNKQFATNGASKKKIQGLLEEFGLNDRAIEESQDIEKVLTTMVDYEKVNAIIKERREESMCYLESVIKEVKNNE